MSAAPVETRQVPRRHSRLRRGLFRVVERTAALCGGRALYRCRHLSPGRFAVREEIVPVPDLAPALDGFTLAQLSDLHGGAFLRSGDLAAVIDAVEQLAPDVVALTGDYMTHAALEALPLAHDLARLRPKHGVFAVFGNHDYKHRREELIVASYGAFGVRFLRNACARIELDGAALALVGLEDLEEGKVVDLDRARACVRAGDVEIVLCHNPLGARALARAGCAAILSGHTHGMQIDLPILRRLGPKHPGLRIALGPSALIVSRGLGVVGVPLRVRAPAEIVIVRLVRPEAARNAR